MKGQTDLKVCPFFPFSRGWSRTSAPQPSPLLQKNHETTFTPPPAPPKPALGSLCHQGQSPAGRGKPARRHLPACRARGKPESAHHGPIKLHDRAGFAAGIACCKAPKSRRRSGHSLLRSAKKPRQRNCALSLIHIWTSRKYFVYLPLQRRVIAAAVALLLFTKPAVGGFSGGIVKTKSDLVFSTKHLVETTRHLVLRRCSGARGSGRQGGRSGIKKLN